jgi:hypothetical protein
MIPRTVIAHIGLQHLLDIFNLALVLQVKPPDKPLPVTPYMIVLSIALHHLAYKRRFALAVVQPINNLLPMVPDLVILLEAQAHGA